MPITAQGQYIRSKHVRRNVDITKLFMKLMDFSSCTLSLQHRYGTVRSTVAVLLYDGSVHLQQRSRSKEHPTHWRTLIHTIPSPPCPPHLDLPHPQTPTPHPAKRVVIGNTILHISTKPSSPLVMFTHFPRIPRNPTDSDVISGIMPTLWF